MIHLSSSFKVARVILWSLIVLPVNFLPFNANAETFAVTKAVTSSIADSDFAEMLQDYLEDELISNGHTLQESDGKVKNGLILKVRRSGDDNIDHIVQLKMLKNGTVIRAHSLRVDSEKDEPELVCQRLVKIVVDDVSTREIIEIGSLLEKDQHDKALKRVLPSRSAYGFGVGPLAIVEGGNEVLKGNMTSWSYHSEEPRLGMIIEASFLTGERDYDDVSLSFGLQRYFSRKSHSLFAGGAVGGVMWKHGIEASKSDEDISSWSQTETTEHSGYSMSGWFGGEVGRLSRMSFVSMARVTVMQEFRTGTKTIVLPGVLMGIKIRGSGE